MKKIFFLLLIIYAVSRANDTENFYIFLDTLSSRYIRIKPNIVITKLKYQLNNNKIKSSFYLTKLYKLLGFAYYANLDFDSALWYLDSAYYNVEKIKDVAKRNRILVGIYRIKGNLFSFKDVAKSLLYYEKAIDVARKIKDMKMVSSLLSTIGLLNLKIGNNDMALRSLQEALDINKKLMFKEGIAWDYYLIAKCYIGSNDEKILKYIKKSKDLYLELYKSDSAHVLGVLLNGFLEIDYYLKNKDYNKALKLSKQMLKYASFIYNQKVSLSDSYFYIAKSYFYIGKYQLAEEYLKKSLIIREEIGNTNGIVLCHYFLAKLYYNTGNIKKFLQHLRIAKEIALDNNFYLLLKNIYNRYVDFYKGVKNYKKAFDFLYEYTVIDDSLDKQEIANKLIAFNVKFKTEQIILENNFLKKTVKLKDRYIHIYNILLIIIIVTVIILIYVLIRQIFLNRRIKFLKDEYYRSSITDKLTGLYNRTILYEFAAKEISKANRHNDIFSIILFDIDNFKKINDKYGHLIGDHVLREVANIIMSNIRKEDLAIRFGGEEILILLPQTNQECAYKVADKILKAIVNYDFSIEGEDVIRITLSGGVCVFYINSGVDTFEIMLKKADEALYMAKKAGKNRIVVYNRIN